MKRSIGVLSIILVLAVPVLAEFPFNAGDRVAREWTEEFREDLDDNGGFKESIRIEHYVLQASPTMWIPENDAEWKDIANNLAFQLSTQPRNDYWYVRVYLYEDSSSNLKAKSQYYINAMSRRTAKQYGF